MYAIAYGQCMQAKLKSDEDFAEAAAESDVIKLLRIIKKIPFHYQSQWYSYRAVHQAIRALYMTSQKEGMTLEQYLNELLNQKEIVEQCGGNAAFHRGLVDNALEEEGFYIEKPNTIGADERAEAKRDAKEAYLYLYTITAAHKLLVGWEGGTYSVPGPSNNGIAYTSIGDDPEEEEELNADGNVLVNKGEEKGKFIHTEQNNIVECCLCSENHFSNMCPKKTDGETDKKKKAGYMQITTDDVLAYNKNYRDEGYGDWGQ
eukprot:11752937-Ditylum_brightwellii.AAC.1